MFPNFHRTHRINVCCLLLQQKNVKCFQFFSARFRNANHCKKTNLKIKDFVTTLFHGDLQYVQRLFSSPKPHKQFGALKKWVVTDSFENWFWNCFVSISTILKGFWHEIFDFRESVSPGPMSILLRPFWFFFSKIRGDVREWMFITGVNDTGDKLFTGVVDTGDKFFVNVNDTGD